MNIQKMMDGGKLLNRPFATMIGAVFFFTTHFFTLKIIETI